MNRYMGEPTLALSNVDVSNPLAHPPRTGTSRSFRVCLLYFASRVCSYLELRLSSLHQIVTLSRFSVYVE
jgi:hypothetical protein